MYSSFMEHQEIAHEVIKNHLAQYPELYQNDHMQHPEKKSFWISVSRLIKNQKF